MSFKCINLRTTHWYADLQFRERIRVTRWGFDSQKGQGLFSLYNVRTDPGIRQLVIPRVPVHPTLKKRSRGVKMTTHIHLRPTNVWSFIPNPHAVVISYMDNFCSTLDTFKPTRTINRCYGVTDFCTNDNMEKTDFTYAIMFFPLLVFRPPCHPFLPLPFLFRFFCFSLFFSLLSSLLLSLHQLLLRFICPIPPIFLSIFISFSWLAQFCIHCPTEKSQFF